MGKDGVRWDAPASISIHAMGIWRLLHTFTAVILPEILYRWNGFFGEKIPSISYLAQQDIDSSSTVRSPFVLSYPLVLSMLAISLLSGIDYPRLHLVSYQVAPVLLLGCDKVLFSVNQRLCYVGLQRPTIYKIEDMCLDRDLAIVLALAHGDIRDFRI